MEENFDYRSGDEIFVLHYGKWVHGRFLSYVAFQEGFFANIILLDEGENPYLFLVKVPFDCIRRNIKIG